MATTTLTPKQQEARKGRITSTRIVKLVNGQALAVFNEMMGIAPPVKDNPRMRFGRALERTIIEAAAEDKGWANIAYQPGTIVKGDFATSVDAAVLENANPIRVIEAKNRGGERTREYDGDEPLESELVQAQWHMDVTGVHDASVCVLLGGNDLRVFDLTHDAELCEGLREIGARFLRDHFKPGKPPPMDGSDAATEYLRAKFPKHSGPILPGGEDSKALVAEYLSAHAAEKAAKERKDKAGNQLRMLIGDAEGIAGDGFKCTWKATKGKTDTDWEALAALLMLPMLPAERERHIKRFTAEKPGGRRLLPTMKGMKE